MIYVCANDAKLKPNVENGIFTCNLPTLATGHLLKLLRCSSVGGVTVSMVAFQAVDPGSTPGRRTRNFVLVMTNICLGSVFGLNTNILLDWKQSRSSFIQRIQIEDKFKVKLHINTHPRWSSG